MRSERVRREVDDLVERGWRIEEESPDRVVLVDREFGSLGSHLVVALLTFWWTMGLGNVAWAAFKYVTDSRRRVVWDEEATCPNCGTPIASENDYCPSCGVDLAAQSAGANACPECGAVVGDGDRYCGNCGTKLEDLETDVTST